MVPVGEDQAPIIEQTNKLVRRLNGQIGHALLPKARALIPAMGRLPGIDGKAKMSKSQGNAIPLSASDAEIEAAVQHMYTDPNHLRATDPGQVKGNVVFTYLDAFDADVEAVAELKAHYLRGGLGDMALKRRLTAILQTIVAPIRERRAALSARPDMIMDILRTGVKKAAKSPNAPMRKSPGLGVIPAIAVVLVRFTETGDRL